ncbi:hypothetical protein CCP3SC1_1220002 [Gammaproteobacteria bacterium]
MATRLFFIIVAVLMGAGYFSDQSVDTEIGIDTSVEKVWKLLIGFDHYGKWNPFVIKLDGTAAVGNRLAVIPIICRNVLYPLY